MRVHEKGVVILRRFLSMVVCLALLAFPLSACSGQKQKSESTGSKKTVTVKLGIWPEDTMPDDVAMFQAYKQRFETANPTIVIQPATYKYSPDTFVALAESGQLPTIFETWFTEPQKLIAGGFVKDITDELKAAGWYDSMNTTIRDLLSKDGRLYGTPRDGYALGLYLNLNVFKDAGLMDADNVPKYPKTFNELVTVAQTIKQKTGKAGICILAKDNNGGWQFSNIAWAFGAKLEVQSGDTWKANLNDPKAIKAMEYVRDLKWKYNVLTDSPVSEDWASGFRELGTGQAGMYFGAQDAVNRPTQVYGLPVNKLALAPMPSGDAGQYMLMGGTPYMFAADATSDQVKATLKFLEMIGKSPVANADAVQGLRDDARNRVDQGIPVIPVFPAWVNQDYLDAQQKIVDEYSNVDMKYFNDYYAAIKKPGVLHLEEPVLTQDMYAELTKVLQAVLTNKSANIPELMDKANKNLQAMIDMGD